MRPITFVLVMSVVLTGGACSGSKGGDGGTTAVTRIQEIYARRAEISDGWLLVMEKGATDPVGGLQKGAEFVSTNALLLAQMAVELCGLIRANQTDSNVRNTFQKVNEEVTTGMEAWKVRAGTVNDKYSGHAQDLNAQYVSLNEAFFETAKGCMPE